MDEGPAGISSDVRSNGANLSQVEKARHIFGDDQNHPQRFINIDVGTFGRFVETSVTSWYTDQVSHAVLLLMLH